MATNPTYMSLPHYRPIAGFHNSYARQLIKKSRPQVNERKQVSQVDDFDLRDTRQIYHLYHRYPLSPLRCPVRAAIGPYVRQSKSNWHLDMSTQAPCSSTARMKVPMMPRAKASRPATTRVWMRSKMKIATLPRSLVSEGDSRLRLRRRLPRRPQTPHAWLTIQQHMLPFRDGTRCSAYHPLTRWVVRPPERCQSARSMRLSDPVQKLCCLLESLTRTRPMTRQRLGLRSFQERFAVGGSFWIFSSCVPLQVPPHAGRSQLQGLSFVARSSLVSQSRFHGPDYCLRK